MKGLILKDFYVLIKQMRVFFVLIVIFNLVPNENMNAFGVMYAAMLPYTALAYDERSHWEAYASMMPYTTRDLVLSKYVLGWCFTAAAALFSLAAGLVEKQFISTAVSPASAGFALCAGFLMIALTLPLMFRFGVEKGRMFFVLLVVVVASAAAGLISGITADPNAASLVRRLALILPAATALCSVVSVFLSVRLYERRTTE